MESAAIFRPHFFFFITTSFLHTHQLSVLHNSNRQQTNSVRPHQFEPESDANYSGEKDQGEGFSQGQQDVSQWI